MSKFRSVAEVCLVTALVSFSYALAQQTPQAPIAIQKQGSFAVGGTQLILGDAETASLSCDHGFVEYQIPQNPRATNILMWHSSSVAVWQNRWDGGDGFQSIFLRRHYPVYLWDGPRVGRANWGCEPVTYTPGFRDQGNFTAWRFGLTYPNWFEGVQFPTDDPEAWEQATRARYDEFDTLANAQLQSDAGAQAVDEIGPVVILTNSAGGWRAMLTALKSESDNVKGIVTYENPGYVFPEGEGPTPDPDASFGPISVPLEEFKKLTKFPIQIVWGDNVDKAPFWAASRELSIQFVDLVNKHGGNAEILELPEAGLVGNTHIPMADLNNVAVANLLSDFLAKNGLDSYQ
jgi:hypothetical protein